jgi:hypothetical protein
MGIEPVHNFYYGVLSTLLHVLRRLMFASRRSCNLNSQQVVLCPVPIVDKVVTLCELTVPYVGPFESLASDAHNCRIVLGRYRSNADVNQLGIGVTVMKQLSPRWRWCTNRCRPAKPRHVDHRQHPPAPTTAMSCLIASSNARRGSSVRPPNSYQPCARNAVIGSSAARVGAVGPPSSLASSKVYYDFA